MSGRWNLLVELTLVEVERLLEVARTYTADYAGKTNAGHALGYRLWRKVAEAALDLQKHIAADAAEREKHKTPCPHCLRPVADRARGRGVRRFSRHFCLHEQVCAVRTRSVPTEDGGRTNVQEYEREGPLGVVVHLSIKRHDRDALTGKDWRDLQRIKNHAHPVVSHRLVLPGT